MKNRRLGRSAMMLGLALALALGLAGCGGASTDGHPGHGVVLRVDADARTVTLDHEDIPGLMKAMTMTFELAPEVDATGLSPGTTVDFRVKEEGGVYTVTAMERSGS